MLIRRLLAFFACLQVGIVLTISSVLQMGFAVSFLADSVLSACKGLRAFSLFVRQDRLVARAHRVLALCVVSQITARPPS